MLGLLTVPYEVLANIVRNVNFDDIFSLGLTCKELSFLIREESICKSLIQAKIRYCNETLSAESAGGGNARALRRVAKRRNALATVSPYTVAIVGVCDAYIYSKGVLCYTLDDRVRILDLYNSNDYEVVISIPRLLTLALSSIRDDSTGNFQVLHYSDKIVSCLYRSSDPDSTAWLIAFSLRNRAILVREELDSTERIFVRHNKDFLYYGTNSEVGTDGYKKWVIHGYSFKTREWFPENIHLPEMAGSEIGSTICFEFHQEYFYVLSNQTSFEVEEIDWTSFYHCVRFPLDSPRQDLLEKTENRYMWRRQHQEGPIDDRWTFLRLDADETTGKLRIVESRKEWYLGSSRSQRSFYTTDIVFPEKQFEYSETYSQPGPSNSTLASASISQSTLSNSTSLSDTEDFDNSAFPDDPILRLRRKDDNPHYLKDPPLRLPQNTHPANDGSIQPTYTLTKSRLRTYHTCCNAFVDLVDDPLPSDWTGTQRLRLRGGSRRLGPILQYASGPKQGIIRPPSTDLETAWKEMYREEGIRFWPAAQDPDALNQDEELDQVYRLLNPPTHPGNVQGTADERSIVYVTGPSDKPQALIFVGFDPAVRLRGLKRWGGLCRKGVGEGPHIDGRAKGACAGVSTNGKMDYSTGLSGEMQRESSDDTSASSTSCKRPYEDVDERDRSISIDRKGKGKELLREGGSSLQISLYHGEEQGQGLELGMHDVRDGEIQSQNGASASSGYGNEMGASIGTGNAGYQGKTGRRGSSNWAWREEAMYRDIGLGFNFGLEPKIGSKSK